MAYIRTALLYESPIIFIQIEQDGKISKETFLSVYPGACGMYFQHKKMIMRSPYLTVVSTPHPRVGEARFFTPCMMIMKMILTIMMMDTMMGTNTIMKDTKTTLVQYPLRRM